MHPGTFTITRIGDLRHDLSVNYTLGGTALASRYQETFSGIAYIPAGQTSTTLTVTPTIENIAEGNQTVLLTLAAGSGYTLGPSSASTVTIVDKEMQVGIQATVPSTTEGSTLPG